MEELLNGCKWPAFILNQIYGEFAWVITWNLDQVSGNVSYVFSGYKGGGGGGGGGGCGVFMDSPYYGNISSIILQGVTKFCGAIWHH